MFKEKFKYYKSRKLSPNFENVLDFDDIRLDGKVYKLSPIYNKESFFGFKPFDSWEVYEIFGKRGLLFIKNPFTALGQRYWTVRCLRDYSRKPNKSNIDVLNLVPVNQSWWEMCQNDHKELLKKLRWITLGYHHDWDTKVYAEENRAEFPEDLQQMTQFLAESLGFRQFHPEAAIINYYHSDSTLSGHTDHSERNLDAPLFSFSFGQSAVFLIGGESIEDDATALFLHSGDIVVMSKESRLCYHGVPKIVHTPLKKWCNSEEEDSENIPEHFKSTIKVCNDLFTWKEFDEYLSHSRINMNVRQVLYEGENKLT